jgi:hypothetical protein
LCCRLPCPPAQARRLLAKVDDYTFDAASWTLIAHEARPGHELQFDSMVEHGVSLARALYAFNSTNAEGWGLYSEYITLPYMPKEAQLISLQFRLLRAARAFIDPELQAGRLQPADAMRILTTGRLSSQSHSPTRRSNATPSALQDRRPAISTAIRDCSNSARKPKKLSARSSTPSASMTSSSPRGYCRPA